MASAAPIVRPRCRLAAVNGSIHALAFTVECTLEALGEPGEARDFSTEVAAYLDESDGYEHYRTVLAIAGRYVDLA